LSRMNPIRTLSSYVPTILMYLRLIMWRLVWDIEVGKSLHIFDSDESENATQLCWRLFCYPQGSTFEILFMKGFLSAKCRFGSAEEKKNFQIKFQEKKLCWIEKRETHSSQEKQFQTFRDFCLLDHVDNVITIFKFLCIFIIVCLLTCSGRKLFALNLQ
jgi:hypothetical protein